MCKANGQDRGYDTAKERPEILDHMTRAEMISELMVMLAEVKDEDLPAVCHLIQQVMNGESPD